MSIPPTALATSRQIQSLHYEQRIDHAQEGSLSIRQRSGDGNDLAACTTASDDL